MALLSYCALINFDSHIWGQCHSAPSCQPCALDVNSMRGTSPVGRTGLSRLSERFFTIVSSPTMSLSSNSSALSDDNRKIKQMFLFDTFLWALTRTLKYSTLFMKHVNSAKTCSLLWKRHVYWRVTIDLQVTSSLLAASNLHPTTSSWLLISALIIGDTIATSPVCSYLCELEPCMSDKRNQNTSFSLLSVSCRMRGDTLVPCHHVLHWVQTDHRRH